jgi:hypothetical protein
LSRTLDESGLPCAELTLEADDITRLKQRAEAHPEATGLLGGFAEEFERVRIQNGHGERIILQGFRRDFL